MDITTEDKKPSDENKTIEAIIERKLRLVENPSSLIIAPRTREGHMMAKIIFVFDRMVNQIRLKAGTYIPIADVTTSLKNVKIFMSRFETLLRFLGDDNYAGTADSPRYSWENPETRKILAAKRTTYVFLPKTEEGRQAALTLKRFDPLLLQFRATCTDFEKAEKILDSVTGTIFAFHNLTTELSSLAKVQYRTPKGLSAIVGNSTNKQTES